MPDDPAPRRVVSAGPWTRSALRALGVLVAAALVLAGYWAWSGRPRAIAQAPTVVATAPAGMLGGPAAPAEVAGAPGGPVSAPTPAPDVVVHVTGLVARPGLVHLPLGSRVADAIAAAGGVTRRRAADSVNLARVLADGEQVVVTMLPAVASTPVASGAAAGPVDLNTATEAIIEGLPGVGPVLAGRILAWRATNGPFRSVDELGEVSGIGDAILAQLRPLVRV